MKILFWNVQRLGSATPELRGEMMEGVLAEAFAVHHASLAVLCEVSGSTALGGVGVNKQVAVVKRGPKGSAQLGYASITDDLNEATLEKYPIENFKRVFGFSSPKKGGADFTRQSKRFVAKIDVATTDGLNVYVYHANASGRAPFLVSWIVEALRQEDDEDFLLIGDLNCSPASVRTQMQNLGIDPDTVEMSDDGPTHNAKTGLTQTYDWAIGGFGASSVITKLDMRPQILAITPDVATANANMSDHLPIIVEW